MKISILQIKSEGEGIVATVTVYNDDFKMSVIDILNYGLDALLENEGPHDLTVTESID